MCVCGVCGFSEIDTRDSDSEVDKLSEDGSMIGQRSAFILPAI